MDGLWSKIEGSHRSRETAECEGRMILESVLTAPIHHGWINNPTCDRDTNDPQGPLVENSENGRGG